MVIGKSSWGLQRIELCLELLMLGLVLLELRQIFVDGLIYPREGRRGVCIISCCFNLTAELASCLFALLREVVILIYNGVKLVYISGFLSIITCLLYTSDAADD